MDYAFAAGAFFLLKWAFVKAHERVFFKLGAFFAEFALGAVVVFAVNVHHVAYGFLFPFHAFMLWVWRLRLQANQLKMIGQRLHIRVYPKTYGLHVGNLFRFAYAVVRVLHHSAI